MVGKTSAKLKGGLDALVTKLMEVLVNTAAIIMQEDSRLTECRLVQILYCPALSGARRLER